MLLCRTAADRCIMEVVEDGGRGVVVKERERFPTAVLSYKRREGERGDLVGESTRAQFCSCFSVDNHFCTTFSFFFSQSTTVIVRRVLRLY